ncbi:MAG: translocation/assembly module TamB domain-containing protein [Deltaproteobacteria bacterium]|nr:translocation/assembly module TamB domain-containing protein [Deltaproteobacteria bacterium]
MRRTLVILSLLMVMFLLVAVSFGFWAVSTNAGLHWIIKTVDSVDGVKVSTDTLAGTVIDELTLERLRVSWPDGEVEFGRLDYRLAAFQWFPLTVVFDFLKIENFALRMQEETDTEVSGSSEEAGQTQPVGIDVLPSWVDIEIRSLSITNFVYEDLDDPDDQVVIADLIAGQYRLADKSLTGKDFAYHSPYVHLDGGFAWELTRPQLIMDAKVYLPDSTVDPELFQTIRVPVSFPGHIEFDGDWNNYSGPARFGSKGFDGSDVWLTAQVSGSWRGIRFDNLQGAYLQGRVAGELDLAWIDSYRMQGNLSASGLELTELIAEMDGRTDFDLRGELLVPYDINPMTSRLDVEFHETSFRGLAVTGRAAGSWIGTELIDVDIDLNSETSHLLATGTVAERVDFDFAAADLSPFHADLDGSMAMQGWAAWSDGNLSGIVTGHAEQLVWKSWAVESVQFKGSHPVEMGPIEIDLTGQDWHWEHWSLARAALHLTGDRLDHHAELVAANDDGSLTARLRGRYDEDKWRGTLTGLTAREMPWGNWSLSQPVEINVQDRALSVSDLELAGSGGGRISFAASRLGDGEESRLSLTWHQFPVDWLAEEFDMLDVAGTASGHFAYEMSGSVVQTVTGSFSASGRVQDELYDIAYEDCSVELNWDYGGLLVAGSAKSNQNERVSVNIASEQTPDLSWPPSDLNVDINLEGLGIARFNRFLDVAQLEGRVDGDLHLEMAATELTRLSVHASVDGQLLFDGQELGPRNFLVDLHWEEERFQAATQIESMQGGTALLRLTSTEDPSFSWPESGTVTMEMEGMNLALFKPWLPTDLDLRGGYDAKAEGRWSDHKTVSLSGEVLFSDNHLSWIAEQGQISMPVQSARMDWQWEGELFSGSWSLAFADRGRLHGDWEVPLSAQFPVTMDPNRPLQASLEGNVQASGALSAIGPWFIEESQGKLAAELALAGTWNNPVLTGTVDFKDGSAYLPITGVRLQDITLKTVIENQQIRLAEFSLTSGTGRLTGNGDVLLAGWKPEHYALSVQGQNLQLVNFPELYVICDPDLDISGTLDSFSLSGSVHIPVLAIRGGRSAPPVLASNDVVVVTAKDEQEELTFKPNVRVVVSLGDKVTVKTAGIDTRLQGAGTVTMDATGAMQVWGEIELVSGIYRAYGARLNIRQGLLKYQGDPITRPELRIFAAREIGSVLAGVQISGTAEAPVVSLYSRPAMPDRDILGYILMGRSVSTERQDSDMLMMGAGALLTSPDGGASKLGLTDIDIQGLYVGVGGLRLRRRLAEKWELESTLGVESGIDLYYIIEFD